MLARNQNRTAVPHLEVDSGARGTYDLDAHMQLSGKDLQFFDEATKKKYTPLLIESSAGMDRTTLTFLVEEEPPAVVARG